MACSIGSELRSWLLYYSLPVLVDVLPLVHFKHYSLLVASMHILTSDNISVEDLDAAEGWLKKFYMEYEDLYGMYYVLCWAPKKILRPRDLP